MIKNQTLTFSHPHPVSIWHNWTENPVRNQQNINNSKWKPKVYLILCSYSLCEKLPSILFYYMNIIFSFHQNKKPKISTQK